MNWNLIKWLVISAAIFGAGWSVNGWRLNSQLEKQRTAFVTAQKDAKDRELQASEKYRSQERDWQDKVKGLQDALVSLYAATDSAMRSLVADRDRMRDDINRFAAGDAATDTLTACRTDAATLGDVLADTLQREEDATAAAETHAASTRSLLDAWPGN